VRQYRIYKKGHKSGKVLRRLNKNTKPGLMTYQHLSIVEKDNLWYLLHLAHPPKVAEIARMLNKHRSTIYREIKSNTFDGKYSSSISKKKYVDKRLKANFRLNKILNNYQLEQYILKCLKLR